EDKLIGLFESKSERIRLQALQFYLKSKGKHRGYTERIETADVQPVEPARVLTKEEVKELFIQLDRDY
ncbi:MAG: hypothetical protein Q8T08_17560, partial [Ignavibacteria bacterium]|nr:hypothetical protein [Ignavibacteria bacterium]